MVCSHHYTTDVLDSKNIITKQQKTSSYYTVNPHYSLSTYYKYEVYATRKLLLLARQKVVLLNATSKLFFPCVEKIK